MKLVFLLVLFALVLLRPESLCSADYEVSVTTIEIWVKVLDKSGNPVKGLTERDFQVYENDKKVQTTCFQEVEPEPVSTPQPGVTIRKTFEGVPAKKFIIFIDLYNMTQPEFLMIRPKIEEYVNQISSTSFEIMLALLTKEGKLGVAAPFSSNSAKIHATLDKLQANATRDQALVHNQRELSEMLQSAEGKPNDSTISQAYRFIENFTRQEKIRSEFTIHALQSFAEYLQEMNLSEHLIILYVSGGFSSDPGRYYYDQMYKLLGDPDVADMPEAVRKTDFSIIKEVQRSIGKLNIDNVTLYAINTRGPNPTGSEIQKTGTDFFNRDDALWQDFQGSMAQIAQETGGIAFENSFQFKTGFDKILADLESGYVICYNPPPNSKKGQYHRIKVVSHRDGLQVRHRLGYVN